MKKLLLIAGLFIFGCKEDPNTLIINSLADVDKNQSTLSQLPPEDKTILIKYLTRKEFNIRFNKEPLPDGLTVREAINAQLKLEEDIKKEKQEKSRAIEVFNNTYQLSINNVEKTKDSLGRDELKFNISFKNNSKKSVKGFDQFFEYYLEGIEHDKHLVKYIEVKRFEPAIGVGKVVSYEGSLRLDNKFGILAETNKEKLRVRFYETEIIFDDGTTDKLNE